MIFRKDVETMSMSLQCRNRRSWRAGRNISHLSSWKVPRENVRERDGKGERRRAMTSEVKVSEGHGEGKMKGNCLKEKAGGEGVGEVQCDGVRGVVAAEDYCGRWGVSRPLISDPAVSR